MDDGCLSVALLDFNVGRPWLHAEEVVVGLVHDHDDIETAGEGAAVGWLVG